MSLVSYLLCRHTCTQRTVQSPQWQIVPSLMCVGLLLPSFSPSPLRQTIAHFTLTHTFTSCFIHVLPPSKKHHHPTTIHTTVHTTKQPTQQPWRPSSVPLASRRCPLLPTPRRPRGQKKGAVPRPRSRRLPSCKSSVRQIRDIYTYTHRH